MSFSTEAKKLMFVCVCGLVFTVRTFWLILTSVEGFYWVVTWFKRQVRLQLGVGSGLGQGNAL